MPHRLFKMLQFTAIRMGSARYRYQGRKKIHTLILRVNVMTLTVLDVYLTSVRCVCGWCYTGRSKSV